ncbi:MAG: protein-glutamate O-methyltransferase CheR [Thermodesulfobacteriota bacterium]
MIFRMLSEYIEHICGLHLDESKTYLIETRLSPLLDDLGCKGWAELYQRARRDETRRIERLIIDRITTPETAFFRDSTVFDVLRYRIIPDIVDRKKNQLVSPIHIRIWSAGCSTGQEVYSIAIAAHEVLQGTGIEWFVLGTDISDAAIAYASAGRYSAAELARGMNEKRIETYFEQKGNVWQIRDFIRATVGFRRKNLLDDFPELGRFDTVFCRNVAIYLQQKAREHLFMRFHQALTDGGYLVLGSSESLMEMRQLFEAKRHLQTIYYQKKASVKS